MVRRELEQAVLELLKKSTVPSYDKKMVEILIHVMEDRVLENIYDSLKIEIEKISKLEEKKKRIELKYSVMVEKLTKSK